MWRRLVHLVPVVLAVGMVQTSLGDVLDPNLVGWWQFDEGSGTVAADSSGQGRDGTLLFDPVWRADGVRGGCLFFDGEDAYVRIANDASLNPGAGSFSVVFWGNIDPTPGTRGDTTWDLAVAKRDTASIGYYVGAQRTQGGGAGLTGFRFMLGDTGGARTDTPFVPGPLGEWVFVAAVLDRGGNVQKLSVDGGQNWATAVPAAGQIAPAQDLAIGWDIGPNNFWFHGRIDDVALFNRALSDAEVALIRDKGMTPALADDPSPANVAADVPLDASLSWSPGLYAVTHDVYFGTNPVDVAEATRANPLGVLVEQDLDVPAYDPGGLDLGQTYYWRIDEVNGTPDRTIFKGEVWRFTAEPVGFALAAGHIKVTASSFSSADEMPVNTINGSGLDTGDGHSTDNAQMWLSAAEDSAWIQYEFDKMYSLHQMLVWNHNGAAEPLIGLGVKQAVVEYSLDGSAWTRAGDSHEFARAPGKAGYASDTTVDFGGAAARFVRITITANWGGLLKQYGLSEIRFLVIPAAARLPHPAAGATDQQPASTLNWRAGRYATSHKVYLGTDEQKVIAATAPVVTTSEPTFDPGLLTLGQTYFWRVDEVNNLAAVGTWTGDVWSFSTQEFVVVDDFESYDDEKGNRVFDIWLDGWENKTGSQVGYLDIPFTENTIVHGGKQAMPLTYSNAAAPFYSETERTFDEPQDWTLYGIGTLTIYFRGSLDNSGQLYAKINNTKVAYNGDAGDIGKLIWQAWNIDLKTVGGNLKNVSKLTIGIEGADTSGLLYIDDIRLYPKAPESTTSVEPDRARLVAHYTLDGNADDSSGNGYHGVAAADAVYVSGVRGQAMECDGYDDHVRIAHKDKLNPGTGDFSITFWGYLDPAAGTRGSTNWDLGVAKRDTGSKGYYVGADRNQGDAQQTGYKFMLGNTAGTRVDTPFVLAPLGEWVFVAAVLDRAQNVHKISVDGGQTWATVAPPTGSVVPAQDLGIGWDIGVNNFWFHGTIDEVRVYDKALSNEEVAWLAGG